LIKELVSVIIPCYNGAKYLAQALESVKWQTWQNWECILIDDGSTDNSAEIFKNYAQNDSRFRYFYQRNSGAASARNKGLDVANGEFIQFLDADDIILPERLKLCIDQFKLHPEVDVVYTDYICFDGNTGFTHFLPAKVPFDDFTRAFMFHLDLSFVILMHSFLFRRDLILKNKFDEALHSHAEDMDCWIRIALSGAKFLYIDEILSIYRRSENTLARDEVKLYLAKLGIMEKYKNNPKTIEYISEYTNTVQHYSERLAIAYVMNKEFSKGIQKMKRVWNSASIVSKFKFLLWICLMVLFSKNTVFRLRDSILKVFKKANKVVYNWRPPEIVKNLLDVNA